MGRFVLSPQTRVGFVALRVHDLAVMRDWYRDVLGLIVLQDNGARALLGVAGNRHVVLSLELGARLIKKTRAGISAFSLSLPSRAALLALAVQLSAAGVAPAAWHRTGFALGFSVRDPEYNRLLLEYDRGTQADLGRNYDFADGQTRPVSAPPLTGAPVGRLPQGTEIGRFVVTTPDVTQAAWYLWEVLGIVRQQEDETQAFMTSGDAVRHIGWAVALDPTAHPRTAGSTGVQYVNLLLPNALSLRRLYANVVAKDWRDFRFEPAAHYLMVTGPNRLTLWFSVA